MTIFEIVKIVLDQLYEEGEKIYGNKLDQLIIDRMKYLSESYSTLKNSNRDPVNYGDPATRFAYVYKYVAAHGDYLVQILKHLRDHLEESVFSSARTRISCDLSPKFHPVGSRVC